ncbi:type II secretion system protein GspM [Delftia tsuruhatensis]|uniref:type II secretion system protein GspM n=1 Tax=Delftia tsuruhatensis TaxID=180282 RepID=UPI0031DCCD24
MTNMNSKRAWRQWAILAVLVGMLLLPLVLVGLWVHAKHQWGQEQLATLEPRYARLLGMQQQEEEIQQALKRVAQAKANHIYPGENDTTQTGNAIQQRLRTAMDRAGLSIVSSQVRPNPEEGPYERIDVIMSTEGEWPAIQMALISLRDITPTIWLEDVEFNLQAGLLNVSPKVAPRLSAQFTFSILRSKTS